MQIRKRKIIQLALLVLLMLVLCSVTYFFLPLHESSKRIIIAYLVSINTVAFLMYGYDKYNAVHKPDRRVPEIVLHILEGLGGTPAAVVSQIFLNHKRNKPSFFSVTWMIITVQAAIYFLPAVLEMSGGLQVVMVLGLFLVLMALRYSDEVISFAGVLNVLTGVLLSIMTVGYMLSALWTYLSGEQNCHYFLVTADMLNVRSEPDRKSRIVGKIKRDTKICVTKSRSRWVYVKDKGWVSKEYLRD
jgi:uncharacterized membrane protein YsdA (DUF1294 family)